MVFGTCFVALVTHFAHGRVSKILEIVDNLKPGLVTMYDNSLRIYAYI